MTTELWTVNEATRASRPREYNAALTEHELEQLLRVCQITETALRPVISSEHLKSLRVEIKSLQDHVFRDRPGSVKCPNLHWLSHMPDDIERYGPVYSWWLFVYERTNKLLKGANSNGHPADTPLIAFNKFLRLASLGALAAATVPGADPPSKMLSQQSTIAFDDAISAVNSIDEQKDATSWQEERADGRDFTQRLQPRVLKVKKRVLRDLTFEEMQEICRVWNSDTSIATKVRHRDSPDDDDSFVLNTHAIYFTRFDIGRNSFRSAGPGPTPTERLLDEEFVKYRGSFFDWRLENDILRSSSKRTTAGFIDVVFEVGARGPDKQLAVQRFIKLRMLAPHDVDRYRFQQRM